jgi:hypothetical protein
MLLLRKVTMFMEFVNGRMGSYSSVPSLMGINVRNFVPFVNTKYPEDPTGPDVLDPDAYLWPDSTSFLHADIAHVLPFHYPNPDGTWLTKEEQYAVKPN